MAGRTGGKRAGARRGSRRRASFQPVVLGSAVAVTACVVAWGYLVYAAIDFGSAARGGDTTAWWFLALAGLGAVACLFAGLMLVAAILRRLGITSGPPSERRATSPIESKATALPQPPAALPPAVQAPAGRPRPAGGRRAAR